MPAAEAIKLLRGHQWREGDVALLEAAAAAAEAVRAELAELTAGGPLRRALRAFAFRRGRL
jgi:hypothetical protein